MFQPMQHNYVIKLMKLYQQGKVPTVGLNEMAVYHDDWCGIYQGRRCNCDPDIKFRPFPRHDPRRN